jgi:hypothetical protein
LAAGSSTPGHHMGHQTRRQRGGSGNACRGGSSAVVTTSGAEERVRARERGKEEETDFTSSMGHRGEGIKVAGRLEVVRTEQ